MDENLNANETKKLTLRVPVSTFLMLDELAFADRKSIARTAGDLLIDRAQKAVKKIPLMDSKSGHSPINSEEPGGQIFKKLTLRIPFSTFLLLDNLARAARQPIADVARDLLIGRTPNVAPPLIRELTSEAQQALKLLPSVASNLAQLAGHAERLGGPLVPLTGPEGHLLKLSAKAQKIGLSMKSGRFQPEKSATLLPNLIKSAELINQLTLVLNRGNTPHPSDWREPLSSLSAALTEAQ